MHAAGPAVHPVRLGGEFAIAEEQLDGVAQPLGASLGNHIDILGRAA